MSERIDRDLDRKYKVSERELTGIERGECTEMVVVERRRSKMFL